MHRMSLFVFLCACAELSDAGTEDAPSSDRSLGSTCATWGGTVSGVPFTDEQAQNAVDFADHATAEELDAVYGVGPSVAARIVDARPFSAAADPLAALDAVPYVTASVLESFRNESYGLWCAQDDGRQQCCVDLGCEGLGGTYSGVAFSDADARSVLDWANGGTSADLEAVCEVGPSLATSIAAARPFRTMAELDAVPYVGPSVLRALVGTDACASEGSVAEEWCATADAECECEGASATPWEGEIDATCSTEQWPGYNADWPSGYASMWHHGSSLTDLAAADPALHEVVVGLLDAGIQCEGVEGTLINNFAWVFADASGTPFEYLVYLYLPGSGDAVVRVRLDADLQILAYEMWGVSTSSTSGDEVIEDVGSLPAGLQAVVAEFEASNDWCDDTTPAYPTFLKATVHTTSGVTTGYTVDLMQMIDVEGGIYYVIAVETDASFAVLGHSCSI